MNQTWSLDGLGNWSSFTSGATTQTRTATAANEIASLSGGSGTPTYDLAGNMTGNGGPTYTYDAWDRLVGASIGPSEIQYEYDGLNRRVEEVRSQRWGTDRGPTQCTFYFFDGQNGIETRVGGAGDSPQSLAPQSQYIWSLMGVKTPLLQDTLFGTGGMPTTAGRAYYLTDANANVTAVVQESGGTWGVAERYVYSPYGTVTYCTPSWTAETYSAVANTLLFVSMDLDTTGQYYDERGGTVRP